MMDKFVIQKINLKSEGSGSADSATQKEKIKVNKNQIKKFVKNLIQVGCVFILGLNKVKILMER
jgi:hypothetical protein